MLIISPVVARDDAAAQALIHVLAVRAEGPSAWTCRHDSPMFRLGPGRHGLLPQAPDPVLTYQGRQLPGQRDQVYALVTQARG